MCVATDAERILDSRDVVVVQTLPKISASAPENVQKSIGAVGDTAMQHMAQAAGPLPMLEAISACLTAINSRGDSSDQEGSEGLLLISVAAAQMKPLPPLVNVSINDRMRTIGLPQVSPTWSAIGSSLFPV